MAIWNKTESQCPCSQPLTAWTLDCLNGKAKPHLRKRVINGTLHRAWCSRCRSMVTIERSFLYIEDDELFVLVRPRDERPFWTEDSALAAMMTARRTDWTYAQTRIVYGMVELREKLIIRDLKLRDEAVELFKLGLWNTLPAVKQMPGMRLILDGVQRHRGRLCARFLLTSDIETRGHTIYAKLASLSSLSRRWDELASRPNCLVADGMRRFAQAGWINMWRWSPHPWALGEMHRRMLAKDGKMDLELARQLPRTPLSNEKWRVPMEALMERAGQEAPRAGPVSDLQSEKQLERRFSLNLDDRFAIESPDAITWFQLTLSQVPELQMTASDLQLDSIILSDKDVPGWYDPNMRDIFIDRSMLQDPAKFGRVLLHEIGHVVHARFEDEVDSWLQEHVGWRKYPAQSRVAIREWLKEMEAWDNIPADQRQAVILEIQQAFDRGNDVNKTPNPVPARTWGGINAPAYQAYRNSLGKWWECHEKWYSPDKRRKFFFSFQYSQLMSISQQIIDYVVALDRPYALMSDKEYFAELYALAIDKRIEIKALTDADIAFIMNLGQHAPAGG